MKNSRMKIVGVLAASALALTGCGEAVYIMTPEEEAAVVSYAAHTLAKFNTYQKEGIVYVHPDTVDEEVEMTDTEQQPGLDDASAEASDSANPEEGASDGSGEAAPAESAATLNQALDLGPIQADLVGTEFVKSYEDTDYMALDAQPGKQFLVLHINLTNQAEQALHVNILSMTPTFVIRVDDKVKVPVQTTILLNDLGTFQGDIAAGGVAETVLLFSVPEDITEASSVQLDITMDGNHFTVNL